MQVSVRVRYIEGQCKGLGPLGAGQCEGPKGPTFRGCAGGRNHGVSGRTV